MYWCTQIIKYNVYTQIETWLFGKNCMLSKHFHFISGLFYKIYEKYKTAS